MDKYTLFRGNYFIFCHGCKLHIIYNKHKYWRIEIFSKVDKNLLGNLFIWDYPRNDYSLKVANQLLSTMNVELDLD